MHEEHAIVDEKESLLTEAHRVTVYLPSIDQLPNAPEEICNRVALQYRLPYRFRSTILQHIRCAQSFRDPVQRRLHGLTKLYALAIGVYHNIPNTPSIGKTCAEHFLKLLSSTAISLDDLKQVLRCYRFLSNPKISCHLRKVGCGSNGPIVSTLRRLISSYEGEDSLSEKKKIASVLTTLLAVLHTQNQDHRSDYLTNGVQNLLIYLLSHEDPIVFLMALELLKVEYAPLVVLQSVVQQGLPGLLVQAGHLADQLLEWRDQDTSSLTIVDDLFTMDQQVPTSLLDCLTTLKSKASVPTAQLLNSKLSLLLETILSCPSRLHPKLTCAAQNLIAIMMQEEPENFSVVLDAGLCRFSVDSIAGHANPKFICFEAYCRVLRNISLKAEGRALVIERRVLPKLLEVFFVEIPADKTLCFRPASVVADTLGEIASYYTEEFVPIIVQAVLVSTERLLLHCEEERKKEPFPRDPSNSASGPEGPNHMIVGSFMTFASKLLVAHTTREIGRAHV